VFTFCEGHQFQKMTSKEIKEYYISTTDQEIRSDLLYAINLIVEPKIAIDCGCGAGSDIKYLLLNGFKIYGFDIENLAIIRCQERFNGNANVVLSLDSFRSFSYPQASLILADASLFFCPSEDFEYVWSKMHGCLCPNGIFCGSFLGPEDTMASSNYDKDAYWKHILVFNEEQVRSLFFNYYEILSFTEHRSSGKSPNGMPHNWHIFSVVARKI